MQTQRERLFKAMVIIDCCRYGSDSMIRSVLKFPVDGRMFEASTRRRDFRGLELG